jgi:hypothetical protein
MRVLSMNMSENQIIKTVVVNSAKGIFNTPEPNDYFWNCRFWIEKYDAMIIFTRDSGHHTCGWWKNPDYERCYHLSISFVDKFGNRKPHKMKIAHKLVEMFFGFSKNLVWCEPPYSDVGVKNDVWHYRLFCDPNWQPIKPRKEVYSTNFTEVGWKSFSEINKI